MTGLMDTAIAKVNQNELDWSDMIIFFKHSCDCTYQMFIQKTGQVEFCMDQ